MMSVTQKIVVEGTGPGPRFSSLYLWEVEYVYGLHWILRVLGNRS